jgi:hypothetical protein
MLRSSKWPLSLRSPHQNPVWTSPVSHTCHISISWHFEVTQYFHLQGQGRICHQRIQRHIPEDESSTTVWNYKVFEFCPPSPIEKETQGCSTCICSHLQVKQWARTYRVGGDNQQVSLAGHSMQVGLSPN